MSTIIDELVTRYSLDDQYSGKASQVTDATKGIAGSIDAVQRSMGGSGGGFLSGVGEGITMAFDTALPVIHEVIAGIKGAAMAAIGFGAAFAALAYKAMEEAATWDTYRRSFSAMLGSFDKGRQMMEFLKSYGMKSGFEQEPIVQAARSITSLGLAADKYLPILEKIALLKGPQSENLTQASDILMRLAGGMTGEAFGPEGLGRFGINRNMLQQYGAMFDKQGQFVGSVADALKVLERLTSESPILKNLKEVFDDSPAVKMSNALDAVHFAVIAAGEAFSTAFLPAIEKASAFIQYLTDSGEIKKLAEGFAGIFGGGDDMSNVLVTALAYTVATMEYIPEIIKSIWSAAKQFIESIVTSINGLIALMNQLPFHDRIPGLKLPGEAMAGFQAFGGLISAAAKGIMAGADFAAKNPSPDAKAPTVDPSSLLSQIAASTKATAQNTARALEIQRMVLGGGELARMGLTPVEMGHVRRRRSGSRGMEMMIEGLYTLRKEMSTDAQRTQMNQARMGH